MGLSERYDEAVTLLDSLPSEPPELRVRVLLERGRVLNSSGSPMAAIEPFSEAMALAVEADFEHLAIDALHMLAIVAPPETQDLLNQRALDLARRARDPRARQWVGSLLNNLGWTAFDRADYGAALGLFRDALDARVEMGKVREIQIAQWCVARALRALGRLDEALAIQQALAAEHAAAGTSDPYVDEELAALEAALKEGSPPNPE